VLVIGATGSVESGPLALAILVSAHLALVGLILLPILAATRSRSLGVALLTVALLFVGRFGGEWVSLPPASAPGSVLHIATWNLDYLQRTGPDAVQMLRVQPVDLVALEELSPEVADAIAADPVLAATYPYQALDPGAGATGMGILSRYPVMGPAYDLAPARLEARIDVNGGPIDVVAAHPFPARFRTRGGNPLGYEPAQRNADLKFLRDHVEQLAAGDGGRVLLLGDFNTAPTEAAFGRLTAGLHDAHAEVGLGPGWTWRPEPLDFIGFGLLRIDLILSTGELRPLATALHCPLDGDHCLLEAAISIAGG